MTEPWRCDHCQQLMYNVRNGNPTAGAPDPKFLDDIHKNVCTLCFELGSVIRNSFYWKALADAYRQKFGQLRPGGNYYPGA